MFFQFLRLKGVAMSNRAKPFESGEITKSELVGLFCFFVSILLVIMLVTGYYLSIS